MTYEEIVSLNNMGFSKDEIMQLVASDNPAKEDHKDELPNVQNETNKSADKDLQQTAKKSETTKKDDSEPAQTNDLYQIENLNKSINNLTKVLQASNLLSSYMPAPQDNSADVALASIINPHILDKK
jgi:small-conductance mechanosensitive channel